MHSPVYFPQPVGVWGAELNKNAKGPEKSTDAEPTKRPSQMSSSARIGQKLWEQACATPKDVSEFCSIIILNIQLWMIFGLVLRYRRRWRLDRDADKSHRTPHFPESLINSGVLLIIIVR